MMNKIQKKMDCHKKMKGFFSLELAICIVVALLLIGGYLMNSKTFKDSASQESCKRDMDMLRSCVLVYEANAGELPFALEDLGDEDKCKSIGLSGKLVDIHARGGTEVRDPWGKAYEYDTTNRYIWSHYGDEATYSSFNPENGDKNGVVF